MKLLHSPKRAQLHARRNKFLFLYKANGSLAFQDRAGGGTLTGSGAVRYAPAENARVNYFWNPTFESGILHTATYSPSATVVRSQSSEQAYGGSHSLKTVVTSNSGAAGWTQVVMTSASLIGHLSKTWSVGAYVYFPIGTSGTLYINSMDAAGSYINSPGETNIVGTGTWQKVVINGATLHQNAQRIALSVYTTDADCTFYTDNVWLVNEATAGEWFEPGVWLDPLTGILGSANASPSVSQAVAWVEEGTTNLIVNPSTEVDTSTSVAVGGTITRNTSYAYIGSACTRIVTAGSVPNEYIYYRTNTSLGYTGSARTFIGSVHLRGSSGSVNVKTGVLYTDLTTASTAGTSHTLTDSWTRVVSPTLVTDSAKTVDFLWVLVEVNGTAALTWYQDCLQLEEKAYATSYCDGSIGTGYAWSGTAHASSSTRTKMTVTTDNANRINVTRGAYAIRALRQLDVVVDYRPLDIGSGGAGTDRIGAGISGGTDRFRIVTRSNSGSVLNTEAASPAIAVNTWYALFAEWSGTAVGAAVGTNVPTAGSRDAIQGTLNSGTTDFFIGSAISSAEQINGYIGPVAIFDDLLTARERKKLVDHTNWEWGMLRDAA